MPLIDDVSFGFAVTATAFTAYVFIKGRMEDRKAKRSRDALKRFERRPAAS